MSLRRLTVPLLTAPLLITLAACAGPPMPVATVTATVTQEPAQAQDQPSASTQETRNATLDRLWEGSGYETAESGNLYVKFADSSEYSCGNYDCIGIYIHNIKPCSGMLYVEANIMSGGAAVGMTNKTFGAVPANNDSSAVLEDYTDAGDGFRISKVTCI